MDNFLSEEEKKYFRLLHRQERERRSADRIKAVILLDKGWTRRAIAEALLLDEENGGEAH